MASPKIIGTHLVLRLLRSRGSKVVVIFLCAFLAIGVLRSVYSLSQKKDILADQQKTLADLEEHKAQLTARLAEATSAAFIERVARDKLGLIREGEQVVIMDKTYLTVGGDDQKNSKNLPSWKQWWGLFF